MGKQKPSVLLPTVHRNGTAEQDLLDQQTEAGRALRKALEAMGKACPNGRDYYPQGSGAISAAVKAHEDRMRRVGDVLAEYAALAEGIADGGHKAEG